LGIDYKASPFEAVVSDVDVVVDTVGGDVINRSWLVLRPDGILVTVAGQLAPEAGKAFGVRAAAARRAATENLSQLSELLEAKTIIPTVRAVFPLAEARQAQELSETHHSRGRIILRIP
jgi:NADPH:quinone reductase-like Zn-dependent oxidoreductase